MELSGRKALVTGAAHRLGRSVALALGGAGCRVVVHYGGSADAATETVEMLTTVGVEAWATSADLREPDQIEALFGRVEERWAGLDLLVNSAASFERRSLDGIDAAGWDRVLGLNLRAPFLCLRQAARLMAMAERPGDAPACVVNISDLSGIQPWPGHAHHGAGKAGLLHLTRIAARELAPGVRVNAVVPGAVLPPPGLDADDPAWRRMGEALPAGRVGDPTRIGETVVFLAENDFITGETIRVDGGEHLLGAGHRQPPG